MASLDETYLLAVRLALPVEPELEVAFASYVLLLGRTIEPLPFHVFHFARHRFTSGRIPVAGAGPDGDVLGALFRRSLRAVDLLAARIEAAGDLAEHAPAVLPLLPALLAPACCPFNALEIRQGFHHLDPDILRVAATSEVSPTAVEALSAWLDRVEDLLFDAEFVAATRIRLDFACRQLGDTARELLIALRRFDWLLDAVRVRTFRLRETLGTFVRSHSNQTYPTGGYAGIAPGRGDIEKLLPSELVWMDELVGATDLFVLKYLEGDLLYLLRDDSQRYAGSLTYVFDLANLRLFLKDHRERFPEYFLVALFARAVVTAILSEIPDLRTYLLLLGSDPALQNVIRELIPEAHPYDPALTGLPQTTVVHVVFNGDSKAQVQSASRLRVDFNLDTFSCAGRQVSFLPPGEEPLAGGRQRLRSHLVSAFVAALRVFFDAHRPGGPARAGSLTTLPTTG